MKRRRLLATALAAVLMCTLFPAVAAEPASTGGPVVQDAWARATPPGAAVAAVYLTITGGAKPDRLLGAATAVAAMTQVHAVTETQGVSRMRETDGVTVPAGGKVVFAPHGLHLMLMNLARPLVAGDTFEVTLQFAEAGPRVARVTVVAADSAPPPAH
jgi:copper(I)-binding protein